MENNSEFEDLVNDVFKDTENALSTTIPYNFKELLMINGYEAKKNHLFVLTIRQWTPFKSLPETIYLTLLILMNIYILL